ncbi:MAG: LysR family transcriptional regulator [Myxococcales bacterium]|nr:LysR family transcriptional regulator [Myxococcales bacterium]
MNWRHIGFDWNHARAFLATAEEGSFSAAARALGVAQPTIGRQIAALEEELGVDLFERVGRAVRPTSVGLDLAEHVRAMRAGAERVALTAAGQAMSLEGAVSIAASEVIAAYLLPPIFARARAAHPALELELVVSNSVSDLRRREADIAVRNFRPKDAELYARKIHDGRARLYAAPAYLARLGDPTSPEDLVANAEIFAFDRTDLMLDGLKALGLPVTPRNFPIVTGNHLVQWELAKRGLGICIIMEEIGDAEPRVRQVLPALPPIPVPLWLTSHRELRTSRRIRVVFDLLAEGLSRGTGALDEPA